MRSNNRDYMERLEAELRLEGHSAWADVIRALSTRTLVLPPPMIPNPGDASEIADKLMQLGAVRFGEFKLASGVTSPVYIDNRLINGHRFVRDLIVGKLSERVWAVKPSLDEVLVAGVATSGISFGAMVAQELRQPFVYVRPEAKKHGTGSRIEGLLQGHRGLDVVVIEDHVSTGGSTASAVRALQEMGFRVILVLSITSYGLMQAKRAMSDLGVNHESLCDIETLLQVGSSTHPRTETLLTDRQVREVREFVHDLDKMDIKMENA